MLEAVPGSAGISPSELTPLGGTLYFVGWNGQRVTTRCGATFRATLPN
jgi:hypothetical protein